MAENLFMDLQPDGQDLRIVLRGGSLLDDMEPDLPRHALAIDPAKLDALRSGTAPEQLAREVATLVSDWLLGADVQAHLHTVFAKGRPFRIVVCPKGRLIEALTDVPFELVNFDGGGPLALVPSLEGIVHVLKKPGPVRAGPGARGWPLRILLVRSNPIDIGGGLVPEAAPVRDDILALATPLYGAGAVRVTVLSSEPGVDRRPTWKAVRDELALPAGYDILVYLGHGDVISGFQGVPPYGVLKLEDEHGESDDVRAEQFRTALQDTPVPVVILAGCLTGAIDPIKSSIPRYMRANQGVAQALVSTDSGVRLAVGMRYRLDTADAQLFLKAFFTSLLDDTRGDVEAAVRAGRVELFGNSPFPPSWSAPVVYRVLGQEPTFEFLRQAPTLVEPGEDAQQQYRELAWKNLCKLPRTGRTPEVASGMYDVATQAETWLRDRIVTGKGVPLVMPGRVEVVPGERAVVEVGLEGPFAVKRLEGRLLFSDRALVPSAPLRSAALRAAGFQVFFSLDPGEIGFRIEAPQAAAMATLLPAGPLFQFELPAGSTAGIFHTLTVEDLHAEPFHVVRGLENAVLVTPP